MSHNITLYVANAAQLRHHNNNPDIFQNSVSKLDLMKEAMIDILIHIGLEINNIWEHVYLLG